MTSETKTYECTRFIIVWRCVWKLSSKFMYRFFDDVVCKKATNLWNSVDGDTVPSGNGERNQRVMGHTRTNDSTIDQVTRRDTTSRELGHCAH